MQQMQREQELYNQQLLAASQGGAPAPQQPGGLSLLQQQMMMQAPQMPEQHGKGGGNVAALAQRDSAPISTIEMGTVRDTIMKISAAILGDVDEVDLDTPLMDAGLTSNSAVILRDEIAKDIPGVHLPPTLIFDYPSVAAMSEFIVN